MSAQSRPETQRVLFIDDDAEHLALVQHFVESHFAVIVDIATTSYGAEQKLNERCYDVVICDINLQGELGITICRKLLEQDPEQPVLILSNYVGTVMAEEARALGVPQLTKVDVTEPVFSSLLRQLLSRRPCVSESAVLPSTEKTEGSEGRTYQQKPAKAQFRLISPRLAAAQAAARKIA